MSSKFRIMLRFVAFISMLFSAAIFAQKLPIKGYVFDAKASYQPVKTQSGMLQVKSVKLEGTSCQVDLSYIPATPDGIALFGRVDKLICTKASESKLFASGKGSAIGDLVNKDGSISFIRVSLWF